MMSIIGGLLLASVVVKICSEIVLAVLSNTGVGACWDARKVDAGGKLIGDLYEMSGRISVRKFFLLYWMR